MKTSSLVNASNPSCLHLQRVMHIGCVGEFFMNSKRHAWTIWHKQWECPKATKSEAIAQSVSLSLVTFPLPSGLWPSLAFLLTWSDTWCFLLTSQKRTKVYLDNKYESKWITNVLARESSGCGVKMLSSWIVVQGDNPDSARKVLPNIGWFSSPAAGLVACSSGLRSV